MLPLQRPLHPLLCAAVLLLVLSMLPCVDSNPGRMVPQKRPLPHRTPASGDLAGFSRRCLGQTTEARLFDAVQFLSPLPPTWSPHNPVLNWEGVSMGCNYSVCQRTCPSDVVALHISQAMVSSFTQNRTIRLDLLSSFTELCILSIDPPLASSPPLQVVVDLMNLPIFVSSIRMPHHELISVGEAANFGMLPLWLHDLDLSYTGAKGTVSFWVTAPPLHLNVSGNPLLHGGIELWYEDQDFFSTMCNSSDSITSIDLRNTGIQPVVVLWADATCISVGDGSSIGSVGTLSMSPLATTHSSLSDGGGSDAAEQQPQQAHKIVTRDTETEHSTFRTSGFENNNYNYFGSNTSIWIDKGVVVLTTSLLVQYQIPQGYFCQSSSVVHGKSGGGGGDVDALRLPMLRLMYADSQYDMVVIEALDGGTTCQTTLVGFQGWATVDTGYIFRSTSLAALAPCVDNQTAFATVRLGNQISLRNATGDTLAEFVLCEPSVDMDSVFLSGSVGSTELYALMLNWTSVEGLAMQTTTGTLTQCLWNWPLMFATAGDTYDNNVYLNNASRNVPAFNQASLFEAMRPCLPPAPPTNSLSSRSSNDAAVRDRDPVGWMNLTADGIFSNLTLHTASGGAVFVFNTENSFLPVMPGVYCHDELEHSYRWNISSSGSTLSVTSPTDANDTFLTCSYPGIVSYVFSRLYWETIHDFDHVIAPLLPCLSSMSGLAQNWNASLSMFSTSGSPALLMSGEIELINNARFSVIFAPMYCPILLPMTTTYCAYVDLYHSTLILQVGDNASSLLTYARSSNTAGVLHNLSRCTTRAPLVFTEIGNAKFTGFLEMEWYDCMPAYSATDAFDYMLWGVTMAPDRGTISLASSTGATVDLTTAACANMAPPTDLEMCPSLVALEPSGGSTNNNSNTDSVSSSSGGSDEQQFFVSLADNSGQGSSSSSDGSVWCMGSLWCTPYRSVRWHPTSLEGDAQRWTTGVHAVTSPIPFGELRAFSGIMSSAPSLPPSCYPDCTYDIANCTQIAYVSVQLALCGSLGGNSLVTLLPSSIPAIQVADLCKDTSAVNATLALLEQLTTPGASNGPLLSVRCEPGGFASFYFLGFPVIGSDSGGAASGSNASAAPSSVLGGLTAWCTTCESIWLGSLYPTSLLVMTFSALVNLLLVLFSNFVVEPAAGATITKLKVKLFVALGVVLPTKAKSLESWLLRCRSPLVPTEDELRRHVDAVCSMVLEAALREKQSGHDTEQEAVAPLDRKLPLNADATDNGVSVELPSAGDVVTGRSIEPPSDDGVRASLLRPSEEPSRRSAAGTTRSLVYGTSTSTSPLNNEAVGATTRTKTPQRGDTEEYRGACRRFAEVYRRRLMRGSRMLRTVDRLGMRRLVLLFDACCQMCASSSDADRNNYHQAAAATQQDRLQRIHFPLLFGEIGGGLKATPPSTPKCRYGTSVVAIEACAVASSPNSHATHEEELPHANERRTSATAPRRSAARCAPPLPSSEMYLLGKYHADLDEAPSVMDNATERSGRRFTNNSATSATNTMTPADPTLSYTEVAEAHLEDAIGSVEADTTAFWVPYVLAQEWFNRRFLLPTDWLLFLQLLYVVAMFAVSVDQSLTTIASSPGEKRQQYSSWQLYSATYFFFFSSSSCMTLLVNAVVRHAYSLDTTLESTDQDKTSDSDGEVNDVDASEAAASWRASITSAHSKSRRSKDKGVTAVVALWFRTLALDPFFTLPVMLCLPALVTHVLPALVLFPFLPVVGFLAPKFFSRLIALCTPDVDAETRNLNWYSWRTVLSAGVRVLFQQVCIVTMVALASFSFDYALLFYARGGEQQRSWSGIIAFDFNARSALCAVEQAVDAAGKAWTLIYGQF